jgi:hypothetical protein
VSDTQVAVNNGVNVEALLGAREALTEAPAAAQFIWRAESEWQGGTHTKSTIEKFFGLGELLKTMARRPWKLSLLAWLDALPAASLP